MTDRWTVTVDKRMCVRTGLCAAAVLEVAESCPIEAIGITDADTGAAVFPPPGRR